jgi:Asp-tRNA(Asn)/Glu-tRNA(Gln) amidotransferase A subunit family amidase
MIRVCRTRALAAYFLVSASTLSSCATHKPTPGFQYVEASIETVQAEILSGRLSCADIIAGFLQRIDTYDQASGLNAIILTNPRAIAAATGIDQKIAEHKELGPLFCAPILLKDNYDTADMPTSGGSIALKDSIPPDDAFIVRKLRQADAIVIAKTNMAEWAFSPKQTVSSSYGVTANAYDLTRVPAGSSGGTASATAASFGVIGMGTDTGNSIRGPSSHLALFGIRSTLGLTSRDGIIPLAFDRDIPGPMTRTVTDAARVFSVIAGYDEADEYTELGRNKVAADYTNFLDRDALRSRRVGVLRALVNTDDADPEVIALFEQAIAAMRRAGADIIEDFTIENFAEHTSNNTFCRRFRYDMRHYLLSLGDRAPIHDVAELLQEKRFSPYIEGSMTNFMKKPKDVHPRNFEPPCPDFLQHPERQAFLADVVQSMDAADVDVVVYPTWTNPPASLDRAADDYLGDNSQKIAPATGLPAATVPMGYSHGNLPAGLQFLGRPYSEGLLFGVAFAFEQTTQHRKPPQGFPELKP